MSNTKFNPSKALHDSLYQEGPVYLPYFNAPKSENISTPSKARLNQAMVINGHGYQLKTKFKVKGAELITPHDLSAPYTLDVKGDFALENHFRNGLLPQLGHGQWTHYVEHNKVNNVALKPWRKNESSLFAKRLLDNKHLWSSIDGHQGLLYERDPNAVLVVKYKGEKRYLKGKAMVKYCQRLKDGLAVEGSPILFITPMVGKIKVLGDTSLSEALQASNKCLGPQLVMLATCNQRGFCKKIVAKTHLPLKPIDELFTKPQGIFNLWQNVAKPKPLVKDQMAELTKDFAALKL